MTIAVLGPLLLGAAVGFSIYYFMRQFKVFNPLTLGAMFVAVLGGPPALKFMNILGTGPAQENFLQPYFFGIGSGFFLYAGYVAAVAVLAAIGIMSPSKMEMVARCGLPPGELEAVDLLFAIEDWSAGKMTDNELREVARGCGLTRKQFQDIKQQREVANKSTKKSRKTKTPENNGVEVLIETVEKLGLERELQSG